MSRARIWIAAACCSSGIVSQASVSSSSRSKRFRFFSRKSALLRGWGVAVLADSRSEAVEESVYHGASVKQVFQGAEGCSGRCQEGWCRGIQIGPIGRDQRFTAIRQDEQKKPSTFAMHRPKNSQRLVIEWMVGTDNRDPLGKVLMMGSVSYVPSTEFIMIACSTA